MTVNRNEILLTVNGYDVLLMVSKNRDIDDA
jgi:hypothetical protein